MGTDVAWEVLITLVANGGASPALRRCGNIPKRFAWLLGYWPILA